MADARERFFDMFSLMCVGQQESAAGGVDKECTLILRSIACRLTQENVKEILDKAGLRGTFSFIYAPRIEERKSNLGYAFVRFRALRYAVECHRMCQGRPFGPAAPNKMCDVSLARNQGDLSEISLLSRRRYGGEDPGLLVCDDPIPDRAPCAAAPRLEGPMAPAALGGPWVQHPAGGGGPGPGAAAAGKAPSSSAKAQLEEASTCSSSPSGAPAWPEPQPFVAKVSSGGLADLFEDATQGSLGASGSMLAAGVMVSP